MLVLLCFAAALVAHAGSHPPTPAADPSPDHLDRHNGSSGPPFDPNAHIIISPEDYDALDEANTTDPLVQFLRRTEVSHPVLLTTCEPVDQPFVSLTAHRFGFLYQKKMASLISSSMDSKTLAKLQQANLSSSCMQGMAFLTESLQNYEPWAVRMVDAGSKIPEGMITGSISSFGNYDSCLAVKAVDAGEVAFVGKYCAMTRGITSSPQL